MALDEPSTSFLTNSVTHCQVDPENSLNEAESKGYRRCQYVSNLLLQCRNNVRGEDTAANSSQKPEFIDELSNFCDKHLSHINAIRAYARKTRAAIDPGFKLNTKDDDKEAVEDDSRIEGLHVYDPCCSESYINSADNPLRGATYMTDKEIARQYDAALGRTLERLRCMRELVMDRFKEHLKMRPECKKEQRRYKLVVRNPKERIMLDRLRDDKRYGVPGPLVLPYIEKAERKHVYEKNGIKVPPSMWLTDSGRSDPTFRCDYVERTEIFPDVNAQYRSPLLYNASSEDTVLSVVNSIVDYVERRNGGVREKKCGRFRVPMTDFCTKHIQNDAAQKLFVRCKQCSNYCLPLESLCKIHSAQKRPAIVPMPSVIHSAPTAPVNGGQISVAPPPKVQKIVNGWRTVPQAMECSPISTKSDYTLSPVPKTEISRSEDNNLKAEESHDLNLKFPDSSMVQVTTRKAVPLPGRRMLKTPTLLPEEMYNVEQKKLKLTENAPVIDGDLPFEELEQQVRTSTEDKRVNHGGNVITNGPVAIIQNSRIVDNRGIPRNRSTVPSTIQTGNPTVRSQSFHVQHSAIDLMATCARTRPFMSSDDARALCRQSSEEAQNIQQRRPITRGGRRNVMVRPPMPLNRPRTLQYAHPVMPSINPSYCIQNPTVSNIVRHSNPLAMSGNGVRAKAPISYVKNGSKNVAVHAMTR
uniref:Zf-C3Hc3H domain-containing protein n=1 Tax=Bursaphelenchus xylophilus TaxID=6326 RepID=A0A1I7RRM7_BURXY